MSPASRLHPRLLFARTSPQARPSAGWRGGAQPHFRLGGHESPFPLDAPPSVLIAPSTLAPRSRRMGAFPAAGMREKRPPGWARWQRRSPQREEGGMDAKNQMKAVNAFHKHVETDPDTRTHHFACKRFIDPAGSLMGLSSSDSWFSVLEGNQTHAAGRVWPSLGPSGPIFNFSFFR